MAELFKYVAPVVGGDGKVTALAKYQSTDAGQASLYLMQELGVNLDLNKEKSMTKAISDPKGFIDDREVAIRAAGDAAGKAFTDYNGKLLEAGVPIETAKATALQYARAHYDSLMNIENLQHPGYASAIGKTVVERDEKDATRDLYLQKEQRRAYKKKVLKKYKARKAAKAAK